VSNESLVLFRCKIGINFWSGITVNLLVVLLFRLQCGLDPIRGIFFSGIHPRGFVRLEDPHPATSKSIDAVDIPPNLA